MGPTIEARIFHFPAEFREKNGIEVREVPFPQTRPEASSLTGTWEIIGKYWIHGGLRFISLFNEPSSGRILREKIAWQSDRFDFSLREIGGLIGCSRERIKQDRAALSLGHMVDSAGMWRFHRMELLQLMIGVSAHREENNPYRKAFYQDE